MAKGYISLHRQLQDNFLWKEQREFSKAEAWIDMLMTVNHTETELVIKMEVFKCRVGESLLSLDSWAKRWGWNKSKVRRFFKLLEAQQMIVLKSERKTTRLTICNYASYQCKRNTDETQMKRKRNADETQTTPNNNDNKENKENNNKGGFKYEFTCFESKERFLKFFNDAKKYYTKSTRETKLLSKTDLNNLKQLNTAYSAEDFRKAINAMSKSEWVRQTKNFNPAHFLRVDNFNKYLNAEKTITKAAYTDSNV